MSETNGEMSKQQLYELFVDKWRERVVKFVAKFGRGAWVRFYEIEDIADELINEFVADDHLTLREVDDGNGNKHWFGFNANYTYVTCEGDERKAQFSTYLFRFCQHRLSHRLSDRTDRALVSLQTRVHDEDGNELGSLIAARPVQPLASMEYKELVGQVDSELAKYTVRGKRDLRVFFKYIVDFLEAYDRAPTAAELAVTFGITKASVHLWFEDLRTIPVVMEKFVLDDLKVG